MINQLSRIYFDIIHHYINLYNYIIILLKSKHSHYTLTTNKRRLMRYFQCKK